MFFYLHVCFNTPIARVVSYDSVIYVCEMCTSVPTSRVYSIS